MVFERLSEKIKNRKESLGNLFGKRGSFAGENLGWWMLALAVAVLVLLGIWLVLKPTGEGAIEYIKQMFNFGGV